MNLILLLDDDFIDGTQRVRLHGRRRARRSHYFFCSISWPQHFSVPLPPLVTMTCELHLVQMYILPSWFAMSVSVPFRSRMARRVVPLLARENRRALRQEGVDALAPVVRRLQ
jgi:hypothetical protein